MVSSPGRWVVADDQRTGKDKRPLIEALTEPVIGFVDAIIGGTSIRLNVTCGEGTAESAK